MPAPHNLEAVVTRHGSNHGDLFKNPLPDKSQWLPFLDAMSIKGHILDPGQARTMVADGAPALLIWELEPFLMRNNAAQVENGLRYLENTRKVCDKSGTPVLALVDRNFLETAPSEFKDRLGSNATYVIEQPPAPGEISHSIRMLVELKVDPKCRQFVRCRKMTNEFLVRARDAARKHAGRLTLGLEHAKELRCGNYTITYHQEALGNRISDEWVDFAPMGRPYLAPLTMMLLDWRSAYDKQRKDERTLFELNVTK